MSAFSSTRTSASWSCASVAAVSAAPPDPTITTSTTRSQVRASVVTAVPLSSLRPLLLEADVDLHGVARVGRARVVDHDEAALVLRVAQPVADGSRDDRELRLTVAGRIGLQDLRVREVARR